MTTVRASSNRETGRKMVAQNRKARHDYTILDTFECGIVLTGTEVKSLRDGNAQLKDAYATIKDGEVWLIGAYIAPYPAAARDNHDPERPRKLLLHREQIERLIGLTRERGLTLVPTRIYFAGPLLGALAAAAAVTRYGRQARTGKLVHDPAIPCYMRCELPHQPGPAPGGQADGAAAAAGAAR